MSDFDLLDRPLVWFPCKFPGLAQPDGDEVAVPVEHEVELQGEILDREEYGKWLDRLTIDGTNLAVVDAATELTLFKDVIKNWRRVRAGGRTVEFNDENIRRLLAWPNFLASFGQAYVNAWRGQVETRSGNSAGSPADGRAGAATSATTPAETSRS
jgi:hypothetical protein